MLRLLEVERLPSVEAVGPVTGREVDNTTALQSYLQSVLRFRRPERTILVEGE